MFTKKCIVIMVSLYLSTPNVISTLTTNDEFTKVAPAQGVDISSPVSNIQSSTASNTKDKIETTTTTQSGIDAESGLNVDPFTSEFQPPAITLSSQPYPSSDDTDLNNEMNNLTPIHELSVDNTIQASSSPVRRLAPSFPLGIIQQEIINIQTSAASQNN